MFKNNISNASTPGFKTLKLQDHQHYTDFKNKSLQQKKYQLFYKKMVDAEKKTNGNNVGSQTQKNN